jgi:hypothetical protein
VPRSKLAAVLVVGVLAVLLAGLWAARRSAVATAGSPEPAVGPVRVDESPLPLGAPLPAPATAATSRTALAPPSRAPAEPATAAPSDDEISPIALAQPCALWGYLIDSGGARLAVEGHVAFSNEEGERRAAQADADGRYWIQGLAPGTWRITARAPGLRSEERALELAPDREDVRVDLVLEPLRTIRVAVVHPTGLPLERSVRQTLCATAGLEPPSGSASLAEPMLETVRRRVDQGSRGLEIRIPSRDRRQIGIGHFVPSSAKPPDRVLGVLELEVSGPVFVALLWYDHVLESRRVADGTVEVEFVLDPPSLDGLLASLALAVVDARTGARIEEGHVELRGSSLLQTCPLAGGEALVLRTLPGRGAALVSETSPVSTTAGGLVLAGLPPGRYLLSLTPPGYELFEQEIELAPGERLDLGVLRLWPAVRVRGRVVDADGNPLRRPRVRAARIADDGSVRPSPLDWEAGDEGELALSLQPGRWLLSLPHQSVEGRMRISRPVALELGEAPIEGGELVALEPVELALVASSAERAAALAFRVLDAKGHELVVDRMGSQTRRRVYLPAEAYTLRVSEGGGPERELPFALADEPVELRVD